MTMLTSGRKGLPRRNEVREGNACGRAKDSAKLGEKYDTSFNLPSAEDDLIGLSPQ